MEVAADYELPIQYDTRVTELVFDPATKEVVGVTAADGRAYKANKGVILACGGWENSPELMNTYYTCGYPDMAPGGTPYNVGDGLRMAQSVGADLWHMKLLAGQPRRSRKQQFSMRHVPVMVDQGLHLRRPQLQALLL